MLSNFLNDDHYQDIIINIDPIEIAGTATIGRIPAMISLIVPINGSYHISREFLDNNQLVTDWVEEGDLENGKFLNILINPSTYFIDRVLGLSSLSEKDQNYIRGLILNNIIPMNQYEDIQIEVIPKTRKILIWELKTYLYRVRLYIPKYRRINPPKNLNILENDENYIIDLPNDYYSNIEITEISRLPKKFEIFNFIQKLLGLI